MKHVLLRTLFKKPHIIVLCFGSSLFAPLAHAVNPLDVDIDDDGLIEIETLAELDQIRYDLAGTSFTDAYGSSNSTGCPSSGCIGYELANNLDFDTDGDGVLYDEAGFWNLGEGWIPIGTDSEPFAAVFEGNGYSINNLYIGRPYESDVGLFGVVKSSASFANINLSGSLTSITGENAVGSLIGRIALTDYDTVTVDNCSMTGTVEGSKYVGGLIGKIAASWDGYIGVYDSYTNAIISGDSYAGGLIGYGGADALGYIDVYNSYAQGDADGVNHVGGLIGKLNYENYEGSILISNSSSDADVAGDSYVGGMLGSSDGDGYNSSLIINHSHATGDVTATTANSGGLVGNMNTGNDSLTTVKKSYAKGDVSGTYSVGGFIGYNHITAGGYVSVNNNYATGEASGITQVGGLIGFAYATGDLATGYISKTYATGAVSGVANTGGLIGLLVDNYDDTDPFSSQITVSGSYWDTTTTDQSSSAGGTGLTTAEMQCPQSAADSSCSTSVYSGWSASTWDFGSDSEYPALK